MSLSSGASTKRGKEETRGSGTSSSTGTKTEQLQLEQDAVDKIVQDVLGGAEGLASIFAGEQASGIFNSSVANQEAGDLAANLVGELAKLTGKTVTDLEEVKSQEQKGRISTQDTEASFGGTFDIGSLL